MKKFNTTDTLLQRVSVLCMIALMVLAAGCSSIKLTYNNGDTLLYWWLNAYLDFDSDQSGWVKKEIDELFQWHRKTQLKDYAQLLATGQRQLSGNVTRTDLLATYDEIKERTESLALKAAPEVADLARSVRPEQIAQMEEKFNKNNETYRKKFMRGSLEDRQKARYKKSMEQFELWFGDFSSAQEAALRQASDARPLNNEVWLEERIRRQQRILSLLRKIQQEKPGKEAAVTMIQNLMKELFNRLESGERKAFFDAQTEGTVQMILTAIRIATPEQKAHAHKRMQGWIDDFKTLAAQPQ